MNLDNLYLITTAFALAVIYVIVTIVNQISFLIPLYSMK